MIRRAKPEDYDTCCQLLQNYSEGSVENWGQTFVAEQEGRVVGFVVCRLFDEYFPFGKATIGKMEPIIVESDKPMAAFKLQQRAEHYFEDMGCIAYEGLIGIGNEKLLEAAKRFGFYERTPPGIMVRKEL